MVSNSTRPIMRKKYINGLLHLHELMYVILAHMIYRPDVLFIVRQLLIMSCSEDQVSLCCKPHKSYAINEFRKLQALKIVVSQSYNVLNS